jgi:hypothetical protein
MYSGSSFCFSDISFCTFSNWPVLSGCFIAVLGPSASLSNALLSLCLSSWSSEFIFSILSSFIRELPCSNSIIFSVIFYLSLIELDEHKAGFFSPPAKL